MRSAPCSTVLTGLRPESVRMDVKRAPTSPGDPSGDVLGSSCRVVCSSEPPEVAPSLRPRVQAFWANCRLWWSLPSGALGCMAKDQGQCQLSALSSCVWTEKESVTTFCCGHCVLRNLRFREGGLCRRAFSEEGLAGQPGGPWRG